MLKRAVRKLDSAGQRLFQTSNGVIRSRKSLHPRFWCYNASDIEYPLWYMVFLQAPNPCPSHSLIVENRGQSVENISRPFLEFLYPPLSQEFTASWLSRSKSRLVSRRRKRMISNLSRPYASAVSDVQKESKPPTLAGDSSQQESGAEDAATLLTLLGNNGKEYDKAWKLFENAGYPTELRSYLLGYLCNSKRNVDLNNAKALFDAIPIDDRSADDYLHVTTCFLRSSHHSVVKEVCIEAVTRNIGTSSWSTAFAFFVNTEQWEALTELWDFRPAGVDLSHEFLSQIKSLSGLSDRVLALAQYLQEQRGRSIHLRLHELGSLLLKAVFTSPRHMKEIPTETILLLTQRFQFLGLLTADHFYNAIEMLQSFEVRSNVIRSIVVYRNFRWHMSTETPPRRLLRSLLKTLDSLEITHGVQYILDEYTLFHGKPCKEAYKLALAIFGRAGDATNVDRVFNDLIRDHGKPQSLRWVTPRLYAHARLGNVEGTLEEFRRISGEYGLKPNTVCWNIVLTAYANAKDIDGAFSIWEKMVDNREKPDSYTFGILMAICAKRGDINGVHYLFQAAKEWRAQVTTAMVDTIVEVYCNNQRVQEAEEVADAFLSLDLKGSRVRMWNRLLWAYAFRADLDSVSRIHSRMESTGIKPDGMTYAALMLSLALIGRPGSARRILRALHRSRRVHASEFHYAIILYAYVKARNRDMVHIIYKEMTERFNEPGLSPRLLMLKNHLLRDLQLIKERRHDEHDVRNLDFSASEKFLVDTIAQFDVKQFSTRQPQPGTAKLSLKEAFPALYYEYIISAYGAAGAFAKIQELFDRFIHPGRFSTSGKETDETPPLHLLATLMNTHLKAEDYGKVEECWKMALPRAVKLATRLNVEAVVAPAPPVAVDVHPPLPSASGLIEEEAPLLVTDSEAKSSLPARDDVVSILPAQRFMLSRCLSLYMRSIAFSDQPWRIPKIVSEIRNLGFHLTTHNWSTYVQMLAGSERAAEQIEAFVVFEEKFMPNFPGWSRLRRGFGVKPDDIPITIDYLECPKLRKRLGYLGPAGRKLWTKIYPDFIQPTYISMVYLASALLDFRERSIIDGGAQLKALYALAPKTIQAIAEMPYLRDKFQGVLLRRHGAVVDEGMEPFEPFVWTGGVLGVGGEPRANVDLNPLQHESNDKIAVGDSTSKAPQQDYHETRPHSPDTGRGAAGESSEAGNLERDEQSPEDIVEPPDRTLDYQDEHDIEVETSLHSRRRQFGIDPLVDEELSDKDR